MKTMHESMKRSGVNRRSVRRSVRGIHRGFTLVELLVVIVIISLLVSMLLPVVGAARGNARSLMCRSNVRQTTLAEASYISDHKDLIPEYWEAPWAMPYYYPNLEQGAYTGLWVLLYGNYLNYIPGKQNPTAYRNNWIPSQLATNVSFCKAFTCPDGLMNWDPGVGTNDPSLKIAMTRYNGNSTLTPVITQMGADGCQIGQAGGANATYNGDSTYGLDLPLFSHYSVNGASILGDGESFSLDGGTVKYLKPFTCYAPGMISSRTNKSFGSVIMPSNTWMIIEATQTGGALINETPVYRHPDLSTTYSYMDGHVESLKPSQMIGAYQPIIGHQPWLNTNVANWDPRCGMGGAD